MRDNIVEEVRQIREELIERHGGIEGYWTHLEALDRAWAARSKPRRRKPARASRKNAQAK